MTRYRHTGPVWAALLAGGLLVMCAFHMTSARAATQRDGDELQVAWARYVAEDSAAAPALRFPYQHCFTRAAATHDLPITLLLAVARGESDFDPAARSKANAHGLMQILWPGTARHLGLGRLSQLYDPCTNVDAGTRYLKELLGRYEGDLHLALAAYNYGPQRIDADTQDIPSGAEWYSGYIYRHLGYVLGERTPSGVGSDLDYADQGQVELVVFATPYRAEAFVAALQRQAPALRLDWFKAGVARFRVVMLYDSKAELERDRALLLASGFVMP